MFFYWPISVGHRVWISHLHWITCSQHAAAAVVKARIATTKMSKVMGTGIFLRNKNTAQLLLQKASRTYQFRHWIRRHPCAAKTWAKFYLLFGTTSACTYQFIHIKFTETYVYRVHKCRQTRMHTYTNYSCNAHARTWQQVIATIEDLAQLFASQRPGYICNLISQILPAELASYISEP